MRDTQTDRKFLNQYLLYFRALFSKIAYKNGPAISGLYSLFSIVWQLDSMMSKIANREEYHGTSFIALALVIIMVFVSTIVLILQVKTYSMKPLIIPMSFIVVLMANFIVSKIISYN